MQRGRPFAGLDEADTDGDGTITEAEFASVKPPLPKGMFGRFDLDKNGILSKEEIEKASQGPPSRVLPEDARYVMRLSRQFDVIDKNNDGSVDVEELTAADAVPPEKVWENIDANGDKIITQKELREGSRKRLGLGFLPGSPPVSMAEMIDRLFELDKDGDGQLTFAEMKAGRPGMNKERFNQMDLDGDGAVTREEVGKARGMFRERARTRRGPGPGGPGGSGGMRRGPGGPPAPPAQQ